MLKSTVNENQCIYIVCAFLYSNLFYNLLNWLLSSLSNFFFLRHCSGCGVLQTLKTASQTPWLLFLPLRVIVCCHYSFQQQSPTTVYTVGYFSFVVDANSSVNVLTTPMLIIFTCLTALVDMISNKCSAVVCLLIHTKLMQSIGHSSDKWSIIHSELLACGPWLLPVDI